jgi:hypothetical protein
MEINALAVIVALAVLIIGPGSGVWVGMRAGLRELRQDNERVTAVLVEIRDQLKTLNGRTTRTEARMTVTEHDVARLTDRD